MAAGWGGALSCKPSPTTPVKQLGAAFCTCISHPTWCGGHVELLLGCKYDGHALGTGSNTTLRARRCTTAWSSLRACLRTAHSEKNGSLSGLLLLERLPWSVLPLEALLMPTICVASENHVKFLIHAAADCIFSNRQGGIFCSGIDNCRLITESERHWRLLCQAPQKKQTWNYWRESFENVIKGLSVALTVDGFWQGQGDGGWRTWFVHGVNCWELDHAPVSTEATQIGLSICLFVFVFLIIYFFGGRCQGGRVYLGGMGKECDQGAWNSHIINKTIML